MKKQNNIMHLFAAFNLSNLRFSILILTPREELFSWLQDIENQKRGYQIKNVYHEEENGVWIIPPIGAFRTEDEFDLFVCKLKPIMLHKELIRLQVPNEFIPATDLETKFDNFFYVAVRDCAENSMNFL
jgi:hypothetical protein